MMDSSIRHLISSNVKWIFIGGKGGVGKTTTSCSLGIILSRYKKSVLIISTDPAHNLSDSFDQKFSHDPTLVKGFKNLYAMEIDPEQSIESFTGSENSITNNNNGILKDLMGTLPGIDEAMSFSKVAQLVDDQEYSVIIFDTAPTGHTLRLLSFPLSLSDTLDKFKEIKTTLFPLLRQLGPLLKADFNIEPILNKIESAIPVIKKVSERLCDPKLTTFVCVCIAEFLSMYETERLVQQLTSLKINVKTVIINQLVEKNEECYKCKLCTSRAECQAQYIEQIEELYSEWHVIKSYLLPYEVRGVEKLKVYSKYLLDE